MTLDPDQTHPIRFPDGAVHDGTVYLNRVLEHPDILVGDYTYYSTFDPAADPRDYAARLAPYLFAGAPEKIRIGRFCQIAHGTQFITQSANHRMDGPSTYPFAIFDPDRIAGYRQTLDAGRDTVVGHDCWLGHGCTILPGAQLGNGVIVGAGAVVAGTVPDYAIVAGNRAQIVRMRFAPDDIAALNRIAWWHWPIDKIVAHEDAITGGRIADLARL
jgi:virginiamycin A acetyltransferase